MYLIIAFIPNPLIYSSPINPLIHIKAVISSVFLNFLCILTYCADTIMTTSSAGGLLYGYKPVVLAGSKEPLKIRHVHSYHRQALKGFNLFLIYRLTRKRVNVFLQ